MKIYRFSSLFILSLFAFATSIEYSGFSIFYGIGQDAFSGYWAISETGNNFSEQHIGVFTNETQLWVLHHPVTIYIDEGDSVIHFDYKYRYGKIDRETVGWIHPSLDYMGQSYSWEGILYAYWALDHTPLFELPLDSGEYFLEFAMSATVVGTEGDTLTASYSIPQDLPFKAYFTVEGVKQSGTEPSSPITMVYFKANEHNGVVELCWKTESESENSHFLICRDHELIGRIEGNGTCSDPHDYVFRDDKVSPGLHEYAIEDVTFGGQALLHETVEVEVRIKDKVEEENFVLKKAYPNPFNPRTVITMHYAVGSDAVVNIYNNQGVLVDQLINGFVDAGSHEIIWDAAMMPSGVYLVTMHAGNTVQSQKIVLMK